MIEHSEVMYPVNEVFATVQAEGSLTGKPAIFVRVQGCPVGCPFCDTKFTWETKESDRITAKDMLAKAESGSPGWAELSHDQLFDVVADTFLGAPHLGAPSHVVFTGGEPFLYDLEPLTRRLHSNGFTCQVETSGCFAKRCCAQTFVTVSPKIDMPGGYDINPEVVKAADEVKFVIGKADDIGKLDSFLAMYRPAGTVWVQPMSCSKKATKLCLDLCMARGYRLSVQWHKMIGVR